MQKACGLLAYLNWTYGQGNLENTPVKLLRLSVSSMFAHASYGGFLVTSQVTSSVDVYVMQFVLQCHAA